MRSAGRVITRTLVRPSLFWLTLLIVGCGEPLTTPEPLFLKAAGSTSMSPLVAELAAAHTEQSPLVRFSVTGLGSQAGMDALGAGEVDLALVSWLPNDLDPDWKATALARGGIAIIVHPSNPADGLGLLQLRDLFSGRVHEWDGAGWPADPGPVQPVSREQGAGTRTAFEGLVMEDLRVTPQAVVAPSSEAVVEFVAGHPDAIGYVSQSYVSSRVKTLKVEGSLPTPEALGQGSYPLTRELWLISADPGLEAVQDFIQFALGAAGQQIVGQRHGRIK